MNTRYLFVLLAVVLLVTACAPAVVDAAIPAAQAVQPANNELSFMVPVTGESDSTAARDVQESRQWSGDIFISDSSSPDVVQIAPPAANEVTQNGCMSEDSLPRPQSGCME